MTTYKASKELVQIFWENGFTDVTEKDYPDHVKRIMNFIRITRALYLRPI